MFIRLISAVLRHRLGQFQQCRGVLMLGSEIDLLMYTIFDVQSDESARQQRLTLVLPCVLLWSNRRADYLSKNDSRDDPPMFSCVGRDPRKVLNGTAVTREPGGTRVSLIFIMTEQKP